MAAACAAAGASAITAATTIGISLRATFIPSPQLDRSFDYQPRAGAFGAVAQRTRNCGRRACRSLASSGVSRAAPAVSGLTGRPERWRRWWCRLRLTQRTLPFTFFRLEALRQRLLGLGTI